ncbi:MAG TPA: hypothetical protein DCW31_01910 [Lactobacillus sp.]|nr:hypothetical protein [Lactobacillus sp.]
MKGKYEVTRFVGIPMTTDDSGTYVVSGDGKPHEWRVGKHTKGKFEHLGQLFLTENNLMVAIIAAYPVAFKERHQWTPMQRFTSESVSEELVQMLREKNDIDDGAN